MIMTFEQEQNIETFSKFEKLTQTVLSLVCTLCTEWSITVRAFYEVIKDLIDAPACKIQAELNSLAIGRWLQLSGHEINCIPEIAETLEDSGQSKDILINYILDIMRILIEKTRTSPRDDLRKKKPFILMGMAALRYFQRNGYVSFGSTAELYGKLAVNVSKNIALTSTLGNVDTIYNLPIYIHLQSALERMDIYTPTANQIRLQMANYHNSVFDYEKCDELADIAHKGVVREGMKSSTVDYFNLQSAIYENKGLYAEALCHARMGLILNEQLHGKGCDENIPVLLQMCNLCLCLDDKTACKRLFEQIPSDLPKYSEEYIKKMLIEAEFYDEIEISIQLIEQAETISYQLFGLVLPYIYSSLIKIFGRCGLYDEGLDAYNSYIKATRKIYGATTQADLIQYYSGKVFAELACGSATTAASLTSHMIDYCPADSPTYCFGIRTQHYLAISYCYATQENELADAYATAVVEQVEKNQPSPQTIDMIAPLFDKIPSGVFFYDLIRTAYRVKIDCVIEKSDLELAEQLCLECLTMINEREAYWIQTALGRIYVMQGRTDEGINVWKKALNNAGNDAVDIADEVARYAYDAFLTDFAMEVIDEASKKPLSGYSNYLTFAEICDSACQYDKRDNLYRQAMHASLSKRQKSRCLYAMAMNNNDSGAVHRLEEAIRLCDPDPSLCYDEELSNFYKQLADSQDSLSLLSEARQSVHKAVRYAPTDDPNFFDEIEDVL